MADASTGGGGLVGGAADPNQPKCFGCCCFMRCGVVVGEILCIVWFTLNLLLGIFGILGAIVAMQMRQGRHAFSFLAYEGPRRLLLTILAYLVLGALIPFVSNTAHVGGLVGGFLAAFVYLVPPRQASATLQAWRAAIAALFLGLTFYAVLPITRWDWNWIQEEQAPTTALAQRFRLAKLKSYHGRNDVDASDGAAFNRDMKRRAEGK